jgi:exodeoxyribonuclease VII large subunit
MHPTLGTDARLQVLSVSELNQRLRAALDAGFASVWVGGEISNLRIAASGHFYFSLKDRRSQIAGVMFRSANQGLPFRPRDGLEVIVRGRVSLYDVRGDLQLYVEAMEPRGIGALQLGLEQLRQRLAAEGLFASERKRALPFWPPAVGVATALGGAAIHDIVTTIRGRLPQARIIVRPIRVQGRGAGGDIVAALADLNAVADVGVIVVGRGGGSLEDLWAFNEERVVRAVAASRVPVVSAVGHEIDVTLTDLVADRRAATPTAAAVLVVPDGLSLHTRVVQLETRLISAVRGRCVQQRQRVRGLEARLRHPAELLRAQRLRLDDLVERGRRAMVALVRLGRRHVAGVAAQLDALSPLAVLERGYAIALLVETGKVVRRAGDLAVGSRLHLLLGQGSSTVSVEEVNSGEDRRVSRPSKDEDGERNDERGSGRS